MDSYVPDIGVSGLVALLAVALVAWIFVCETLEDYFQNVKNRSCDDSAEWTTYQGVRVRRWRKR